MKRFQKITAFLLLLSFRGYAAPENSFDLSHLQNEFRRDAAQFRRSKRSHDNYEVKSYHLRGHFNWKLDRLEAEVDIRFKTVDGNQKSIVLDSRVSQIIGVSSGGFPVAYSTGKETLAVDLSSLSPETLANEIVITVRYQTGTGSGAGLVTDNRGLFVVPTRQGDPIQVPVLYTRSEPTSASAWMPCNDVPSNRALFSTEFTMAPHETFISNGDLLKNEVAAGVRTVKYSTRYTLPTYLMAFAQGEFVTHTRYHGSLPISIVARRGVPVDWDGMLDRLIHQFEVYESLLIPYPFEKYALVLLPLFGGGMEHVGITFQSEERSQQSLDFGTLSLTAHELGHQWFGDYMTIEKWDDLWIKEGMATLLAEEASRSYEDKNASGSLLANRFWVSEQNAVIDPLLAPQQKYNSGPYGRSAWVLTQIRSLVGEANFWGTLRNNLNNHAFGVISTDEFVQSWVPSLGAAGVEKLKKILYQKGLPDLTLTAAERGKKLAISLKDPTSLLLAPFEVRRYTNGNYETLHLENGRDPVEIADNQFLVIDPQERHPSFSFLPEERGENFPSAIVPKTAADEEAFLKLGTQFQTLALKEGSSWNWTPEKATSYLKTLGSERARMVALQISCDAAEGTSGTELEAWKALFSDTLYNPPYLGMRSNQSLGQCNPLLPDGYQETRLAALRIDPSNPNRSETEISFLALFPSDPEEDFAAWSAVGLKGPNTTIRTVGLLQLLNHLSEKDPFTKPADADLPQWKQYFRSFYLTSEVDTVIQVAIESTKITQDKEALAPMAQFVRKPLNTFTQKSVICAAYEITKQDLPAWTDFLSQLGSLSKLRPELQEAIAKPSKVCG